MGAQMMRGAAALLLLSSAAVARADETKDELAADAIAAAAGNGPSDRSLKAADGPGFELVATDKDKVGTLSWGFSNEPGISDGAFVTDHFTLTASTKLSGGDGEILGLKGFTNGTEVKLSFVRYSSKANAEADMDTALAAARQNCLAGREGRVDPKRCDIDNSVDVGMFIARHNPEGHAAMMEEVLPGNTYFFGVEAAGNQAEYEFLDRATFAEDSRSRFGFTGTVFGGMILPGQTAITGSFTYKRQYRAADDVTLCQPVAGTIQSQCITAADGGPTRKTRVIVAAEVRHAFPVALGSFSRFAIAPELSFDAKSEAASLDVPLYFVGDGTGGLRGGIRGVLLSEKDAAGKRDEDFTLALFIGVPFSLFR